MEGLTQEEENIRKHRNQQLRIQCIDYATRVIGMPTYGSNQPGETTKRQDDVIKVAKQIHKFVTSDK